MKLHKKNKILAGILVVALMASGFQGVSATTMNKAKNEKQKAEKNLDDAQKQIDAIEDKQEELQSEINAKDAELVNLLVNIGILEDELDAKNNQLDQVTKELAKAQDTAESQYASMKKRIQFMYENGDTAMVETLLASEDMSDFLNRVEYVSQVYEYDRNLLTQYENTVQQVAELKVTVETEKAELEDMQSEYAAQQISLENILAEKKAQMGNYDNQLATAQAAANEYKKTIAQQNEIIKEEERKIKQAEEARAKANSNSNNKSGAGTDNNSNNGGSGTNNNTNTDTNSGGGQNPGYSTNVSGSAVVSYACQFIGNPYVWGGTSLTNGADCSGFVMSVFANFGISLPHSSAALQGCGKAVSYADAQPGDLICYSGHVAIYMGGGQIVHAQSAAVGITTSSATYRTIVAVRRVL